VAAESDFDPYRKWLGIPADQQPPTHYRLLGLADFEKDHDVIDNACERCSAHVKTFATGENAELAKRILKELSAARRCLFDPKARKAYDEELRKLQPPAPPTDSMRPVPVSAATPIPKAQPVPVSASPSEESPHPLAELGTVRAGGTSRSYQKRAKKSNAVPWLMALGLAAFLLMFSVIYVVSRKSPPVSQPSIPTVRTPSSQPKKIIVRPKKTRPKTPKVEREYIPPIRTEHPDPEKFEKPPSETEPSTQPKPQEKTEESTEKPATVTRLPIPEGEPLQAARRWLREKYREQLSQTKTPAEKKSALEVLIEGAGDPEQVPAQRYVLLQRAGELAIELVDVEHITLLNRELATRFEEDYYKLQGEALMQAERKATSPEQGSELYTAAGELLEQTTKLRRYDVAIAATEVASRSARRAGDLDAQRSAEDLEKELKVKLAAQQAGTEPGPLESLPPTAEVTVPKQKTAGLIHHWKFDEAEGEEASCAVTKQSSPLRNAPEWVKGRIGSGLKLEAGRYVAVVDGPKFDKNDPYTLAAWVKTSHTEPMSVIARVNDDNAHQGFDLSIVGLAPHGVLVHSHPASSLIVGGSEAFSADEWHHLAATHDGSARATGMKIYVDGVEQTPNVMNDSLDASTLTDAPLNIGQRKGSSPFVGVVDDVRIYNRALTATEIVALVKEAGKSPE
jgi:hypothetical protein